MSKSDRGPARYKAATRKYIESTEYDLVAGIGDQASDLPGGHAERAFKLPNPMYEVDQRLRRRSARPPS